MSNPIIIVWDCGATNFRTIAIDSSGKILAEAKSPNQSVPQIGGEKGWLIWEIESIFSRLCELTGEIAGKIDRNAVAGLIITTWGADAAPVDKEGNLVYPLISWQCPRTNALTERIRENKSAEDIFARTGYQILSFNTLLKIIWLKENAPEAWSRMYRMLTVPAILNHRLSGVFSVDPTMAGTSMAFSIANRDWDSDMLGLADADETIWPEMYEPGSVIGTILPEVARRTNLPADVKIVTGGHDTQFAMYGSGATINEAILSSGTWEILMGRTQPFEPDSQIFESGILVEQDAQKGLVDPQFLMMASGTLEWVKNRFWKNGSGDDIYPRMTGEAESVPAGSNGITFLANFMPQTGPGAPYNSPGAIIGLGVNSSRGEIYRAALEGLSMQLRNALEIFSRVLDWKAEAIRIVGGGSKNPLWNQIRADVTGLPIITTKQKEATVLGAALFALVGIGEYSSVEDAQKKIDFGESIIEPSTEEKAYEGVYTKYMNLVKNLGALYHGDSGR